MIISGKGQPLDQKGIQAARSMLGVSEPVIWAIIAVETGGFGFLPDRRTKILFERHIFYRLTNGEHPDPVISDETPGGYIGGPGEYDRLERAMTLNPDAALQSCSWGLGQIMGMNFYWAGYDNVQEMVEAFKNSENEHLMGMAQYIVSAGLSGALKRLDWVSFARGYNGPGFAKNQYDKKLEKHYRKFMSVIPDIGMRRIQAALLYLGFDPGPIDGIPGPQTRKAMTDYGAAIGVGGYAEVISCLNGVL